VLALVSVLIIVVVRSRYKQRTASDGAETQELRSTADRISVDTHTRGFDHHEHQGAITAYGESVDADPTESLGSMPDTYVERPPTTAGPRRSEQ
jgi:hypothetical protein